MSDHGFGTDVSPPPPPPPPANDSRGGSDSPREGAEDPTGSANEPPGRSSPGEGSGAPGAVNGREHETYDKNDKSGTSDEAVSGDEGLKTDSGSLPQDQNTADAAAQTYDRNEKGRVGADDGWKNPPEGAEFSDEDFEEPAPDEPPADAQDDDPRKPDGDDAEPVTEPDTPDTPDAASRSDEPDADGGTGEPDPDGATASDGDRATTPDADDPPEPDRDGATTPDHTDEKGSDLPDRTGSHTPADDASHDPAETRHEAGAGASPAEDNEASERSGAATSAPETAERPSAPAEQGAESPEAGPDADARGGEGAPEPSGPGSELAGRHGDGARTEDVPPRQGEAREETQGETSEQQPRAEGVGRPEGSTDFSPPADNTVDPEPGPDGRPQGGDPSQPAGDSLSDTGGTDADTGVDAGVEAGIEVGAAVAEAALDVAGTITSAVSATVSEAAARGDVHRAMAGARENQGGGRFSPDAGHDASPDAATAAEGAPSQGPEHQGTAKADGPGDLGADTRHGAPDQRLDVVREALGDQHPEVTSVLSKLIEDTNRLDLTEGLKEPGRAEATMGIIKEVAEGRLLGKEGSLTSYTAQNPGRGPLFDRVSDDINRVDGESRKGVYVQESKAADPEARTLGPDVSGEQSEHLSDYADRLQHEVEPAVFEDVIGLIDRLPDAEGVEFSARTKSADGLVDKVQRMTSGSEGRPARPDYQVGDVIDAVGARITAKDTAQLESLLEGAKEHFGVGGEGGRILEIENMYAEPKNGNPNYRVIPMVVSIEAGGKPYTYELQLTTKRASVAADLEHNTVYKDHVNASDDEKRVVRTMQAEAAALDQEETIRRHSSDK
ncbi:hypothetical protein [Streptomyces sp. cmx-18-6]|uniref:hypothetical protein n=1 Tax=Streptomyces sp. cmx-18-6 TaxID=2790930 RepID=UPI0039806F5B